MILRFYLKQRMPKKPYKNVKISYFTVYFIFIIIFFFGKDQFFSLLLYLCKIPFPFSVFFFFPVSINILAYNSVVTRLKEAK